MNPEEKAKEYFISIIKNYDFDNGNSHVILKNPIEVVFVFGMNIKAKFNYENGSWYELESRDKIKFKFNFKDKRLKKYISDEINKATTCATCGLKDFKRSDGYPSNNSCPYEFPKNLDCKTIEENKFSYLVPNMTR
jgi:hypothetical protein